jgi:hypothetical protein
MDKFVKKHAEKLNAVALILMLVIPFLLYKTAMQDSIIQVKVFLGLMIATMLYVMKWG